jgi:hypothetical protein
VSRPQARQDEWIVVVAANGLGTLGSTVNNAGEGVCSPTPVGEETIRVA